MIQKHMMIGISQKVMLMQEFGKRRDALHPAWGVSSWTTID